MQTRRLAEYFSGAAGKYLAPVESDRGASNQHEVNGVAPLRALLGEPPKGGRKLTVRFLWLDDEGDDRVEDGSATWYDARASHPTRTEYRLYYRANGVMDQASEGDFFLFAVPEPGTSVAESGIDAVVVISPPEASVGAQLRELFGLAGLGTLELGLAVDRTLDLVARRVLELMGMDVALEADHLLGTMQALFGQSFPRTSVFSAFARETAPFVDPLRDPDRAILVWMDHEEAVYRTFEKHLLTASLHEVRGDVDATLAVAMQTFQRRRARAGHALEGHVEAVLRVHGVTFETQAVTEGRKRPDFLFPSAFAYHDLGYPARALTMLAVKTTCKDRWRQVLSEADRIPAKHLLTLEAPISDAQMDEMAARELSLVVPEPLHAHFPPARRESVGSVDGFIDLVQSRF